MSRDQERRVLYAALAITTCVAEVYQATSVIARNENAPHLAAFDLIRDVNMLDLTGTWPTQAGASMALCSALDRVRTQAWARAIYDAYPESHGLWYPSAMHANASAIVLNERAISAIPLTPRLNMPLAAPALHSTLLQAAHAVGYALG